jgi:hypothetical protein
MRVVIHVKPFFSKKYQTISLDNDDGWRAFASFDPRENRYHLRSQADFIE